MNHHRSIWRLGLLGVALLGASCSTWTGPDSNTDVFKTPDQAAAARKQKLMTEWQDLACRIANAQRPDVQTIKHPAQSFALQVRSDGVQQTMDMNPIFDKLLANQGKEREPILEFLDAQMPEFDRARLKAMGFNRARELVYPVLANGKQTDALAARGAKETLIVNKLVIDLNWAPVVRWPGTEASTPVSREIASAWSITPQAVSDAAIANLKRDFAGFREPYDTVELPGVGRYGSLRSDANAAFVLLPEFVAKVRRQWDTSDDLVLFLPSRSSVMFVQSGNKKALDVMYPEWSKMYTRVTEPLISQLVLAGDKGLSLYNYTPPEAATKPKTQPATKRVYIVN